MGTDGASLEYVAVAIKYSNLADTNADQKVLGLPIKSSVPVPYRARPSIGDRFCGLYSFMAGLPGKIFGAMRAEISEGADDAYLRAAEHFAAIANNRRLGIPSRSRPATAESLDLEKKSIATNFRLSIHRAMHF